MSLLWTMAAGRIPWSRVEEENDYFNVSSGMIHDAMKEHFGHDYRDRITFERRDLPITPADDPGPDSWHSQSNVNALARIYRMNGPSALPPATFVRHPESGEHVQIDGNHRRAAAARAGLTSIPAYYGEHQ